MAQIVKGEVTYPCRCLSHACQKAITVMGKGASLVAPMESIKDYQRKRPSSLKLSTLMPCFVQMPRTHDGVRPRPVHVAVPSGSLYLGLTARRWSLGFADALAFFWRLLTPVFLQCLRINLLNIYLVFF